MPHKSSYAAEALQRQGNVVFEHVLWQNASHNIFAPLS